MQRKFRHKKGVNDSVCGMPDCKRVCTNKVGTCEICERELLLDSIDIELFKKVAGIVVSAK